MSFLTYMYIMYNECIIKTTVTYEVEYGFMHYLILSLYLKDPQNFE